MQLVQVVTSPIPTIPLAINVPPLVSNVLASQPYAQVAFPPPQLRNTTTMAHATANAFLEHTQTALTVPYATAPLHSALLAASHPQIAPLAPLENIFPNLDSAPVLLVAQPQALTQSAIRSTMSAFPPVLTTWCW